jgi:non-heme chloroperoxidase
MEANQSAGPIYRWPEWHGCPVKSELDCALLGAAVVANVQALAKGTAPVAPSLRLRQEGIETMSTITTKDGVETFYKDWGHGQPIVFHHGWPLSSDL